MLPIVAAIKYWSFQEEITYRDKEIALADMAIVNFALLIFMVSSLILNNPKEALSFNWIPGFNLENFLKRQVPANTICKKNSFNRNSFIYFIFLYIRRSASYEKSSSYKSR